MPSIRGHAIRTLLSNPERCPLAVYENASFPYEIRQLTYGLGRNPRGTGLCLRYA